MNKDQYVQQPMLFSASEFDKRKEKVKDLYLTGTIRHNQLVIPATDVFTYRSIEELVDHSQEMAREGRERCPYTIPLQGSAFFSIGFRKSAKEQEKELNTIYSKVEDEYRNEIESFNNQQVELLTQQLFEAERRKELKKEEEKKQKQMAQASLDAQEYFQSLMNKEDDKYE